MRNIVWERVSTLSEFFTLNLSATALFYTNICQEKLSIAKIRSYVHFLKNGYRKNNSIQPFSTKLSLDQNMPMFQISPKYLRS